jgi:hypothetical protein
MKRKQKRGQRLSTRKKNSIRNVIYTFPNHASYESESKPNSIYELWYFSSIFP